MSDLLVYNARVRTLEADQPTAEAVLIRSGRITAIGTGKDLLPQAGAARRLDANGQAVLPGLIDSHVHFSRTGLFEGLLVNLRQTKSIPEVLAAVRRRAGELPAGALVMAHGFQDVQMAENRYPTLTELDEAAPEHMVWIVQASGHSGAANSRTLAFVALSPDVPGIERDISGAPTGVLRQKASAETGTKLLGLFSPEDHAKSVEFAARLAAEAGATTVYCLEGGRIPDNPDVKALLSRQAELPVNTLLYWQTTEVAKVLEEGLPRIGGCILVDGTPAAHTGALFEPYADRPDTAGPTYWQQEDLDAFVWQAHSAGLQVALHATCERAIDQALTAYERALARLPRLDHRHRIEHFYFPRKQDIQRAARLGVLGGVQPYFEQAFREMYRLRLGSERARRVHPYRDFFDAGARIGGGSDSFVTPIDPLAGIAAAVNHSVPEQRLTPQEAVRLFTSDDAYLAFQEHEIGTLRPGKRGDLVVLSDDPLAVLPEALGEIKVEATVARGQVVYER